MKYVEEFGKKITHPHVMVLRGDDVWKLYAFNTESFDNWMKPDMKAWLNNLPPVPVYSWMPRWSPYKPTRRAWAGARPHERISLMVNKYGSHVGDQRVWCAEICFARREDAMKFKLVWA